MGASEAGYILVGKYLRVDPLNLYFTPAGHSVPGLPEEIYRD
jgi:hypothetical protein